jgi:hypothetical protein
MSLPASTLYYKSVSPEVAIPLMAPSGVKTDRPKLLIGFKGVRDYKIDAAK